jgi:4-diphosphocytidyl-2-C-methyl-D-erythritol kinase
VTNGRDPASRRAEVTAPAKLNLGLRITGRREDGYHELESLFVPIDWADDVAVEIEEAAEASVALTLAGSGAGIPADDTNLAVRAAVRFLESSDLHCRVRIELTKRLPAAAGLGGGSSDAGAVLRALAALFPDALPPHRLAELALAIGADVPFFLDPKPAQVSGVGERIEPVPGMPRMAVLLMNPGIPLSTAEVFQAYDARPATASSLTMSEPDPTLRSNSGPVTESAPRSVAGFAHRLHNDLEAAAVRLCPPVARLQQRLRSTGAVGVGMSGSGPTVFGLYLDAASAAAAQAQASLGARDRSQGQDLHGTQDRTQGQTRGQTQSWARVAWTLESR